jgi:predicted ATPase
VTLLCGDWNAAERFINLLIDHTAEHALDLWRDWGMCFDAMLLIARGNLDEGLKALKEALDDLPQDAFFARYAGIRATLAEALGRVGAISSGHATIDEALVRSEEQGERWYIAEFLRVKGELLWLERTPKATREAEAHFRRSLDCARQQEALSWELRTASSLARLYQGQGQFMEARDTVGSVYARFKEGFETADLKAANALMSAPR